MQYEVELKFPLDDAGPVLEKLEQLGATRERVRRQRDRYFGHPARDFAATDEAFRIRSDGQSNCVTYKGPVEDIRVKSRREMEIPFGDGQQTADQLAEMLTLLGFREVRTVAKRRTPYRFEWENRPVELTLDDVEGLGRFVEIEILADAAERDAARDSILNLGAHLNLQHPQRKSYLCLLLEQESQSNR